MVVIMVMVITLIYIYININKMLWVLWKMEDPAAAASLPWIIMMYDDVVMVLGVVVQWYKICQYKKCTL